MPEVMAHSTFADEEEDQAAKKARRPYTIKKKRETWTEVTRVRRRVLLRPTLCSPTNL